MAISKAARDFNWLINGFTERVAGVVHAVVVSSDGLLVATSDRLPRDSADQLAAVTSSLVSVIKSAARIFDADDVRTWRERLGDSAVRNLNGLQDMSGLDSYVVEPKSDGLTVVLT